MISKILNRLSLVCLLSVVFCSCVREVSLDVDEQSQIVVECVLLWEYVDWFVPVLYEKQDTRSLKDEILEERNTRQVLRLSKTKGASKLTYEPVTDARAILIDLTASAEIGEFERTEDDIWTLDYVPVLGHKYRLEVSVPGYDLIYAEQTMPCHYDEFGYVWDNPSGPWWVYVLCIKDNEVTIVDELCTDLTADNFNLTGKVYDSYKSYVDFDYAYKHAPYFPHLDGCAMHYRYLRFPDEVSTNAFFDLNDYLSHISFNDIYYKGATYIMVSSRVSEDYDRYLKEAFHYSYLYNESADLSSIYVRDDMSTNIHGALGVFGAQASFRKPWWYPKNND